MSRDFGTARSHAAVSLVNALFDGTGAAFGVDLPAEVTARLAERTDGSTAVAIEPPESATRLVRATAEAARAAFGVPEHRRLTLRLRSEIPWAVGLKSSSAIGTAILRATAAVGERPADPIEIARLAASVARDSGQSATGALDDALACSHSGIWAADTRSGRVLFRQPMPEVDVTLWIPPGTHPPSPAVAGRFARAPPSGALHALAAGRIWEAMTENSRAVEAILDTPALPREELEAAGALAVGLSGLGPAVAVVTPPGGAAAVARRLNEFPGRVLTVPVVRDPGGPSA